MKKVKSVFEQRLEQEIDWILAEKESSVSLYSVKELARNLKVSPKTVHNWRNRRLIVAFEIKHRIFFSDKAVIQFLSNYTIKRKLISNH